MVAEIQRGAARSSSARPGPPGRDAFRSARTSAASVVARRARDMRSSRGTAPAAASAVHDVRDAPDVPADRRPTAAAESRSALYRRGARWQLTPRLLGDFAQQVGVQSGAYGTAQDGDAPAEPSEHRSAGRAQQPEADGLVQHHG